MLIETATAVRSTPPSPAPARGSAPAGDFQAALAAAEQTASTPPIPSYWNDTALATLISGGRGGISTEKAVNWYSKGDRELTAEDIARLKEQYDVTDLSPQGYYDLVADLTQLEVLSGADCMGVHLATAPPPGRYFVPVGYSSFSGNGHGFRTGNMIQRFTDTVDVLMEHLAWADSAEYRSLSRTDPGSAQKLQATIQKDLTPRQRMLELLTQLQR